MAAAGVEYLVFDVESVADQELVARIRYPREAIAPAEALCAVPILERKGTPLPGRAMKCQDSQPRLRPT